MFGELDKVSAKSLALRGYSFLGIIIIIIFQIWSDSGKSIMLSYPRVTKLIIPRPALLGRKFATEGKKGCYW